MTRVLIIRLSSIGDIIHTFPMIEDIKLNIENCLIDWVIDESFEDLLKFNENIHKVVSIPFRQWKKNKFTFIHNFIKWCKNLDFKKYDFIIDSQGLVKSAVITRCFDGPTYGYGISSVREKFACVFYKNKINIGKNFLAVTKNRLLAREIFEYSISLKVANFGLERFFINKFSRLFDFSYVIVFHATSQTNKKYMVREWVAIINHIIKLYKFNVILPYGSPKEREESLVIKSKIDSEKILVPEKMYSFVELQHLIYGASVVLGVDTGLIHLSNALNKKTIAIYTCTNPNKTGVVESEVAKNIGNTNKAPSSIEVITLFDKLINI